MFPNVSARVFDCKNIPHSGSSKGVKQQLKFIKLQYDIYGAIRIINSPIKSVKTLLEWMDELGFSKENSFESGGRTFDPSDRNLSLFHFRSLLRPTRGPSLPTRRSPTTEH